MSRKVTARKLLVLCTLIANPQSSATKVAKIIGSTPSNVTRILWELTSLGLLEAVLVERRPNRLYETTEEGKKAVASWYDQLAKEDELSG